MIKKIIDHKGILKTYADKEKFVICKYKRSSTKFNYTLTIKCLNIREGFEKLKEVKDFLEKRNVAELLKPYYRTKNWIRKNQLTTLHEDVLNDRTINILNNPGYSQYQFVKYNIDTFSKEDLKKLKKEINHFNCKEPFLKHLKDEMYQLENANNHSKKRMKSLKTEFDVSYEILNKLNREEIKNIGNDLIEFLNKNTLKELRNRVSAINKDATKEGLKLFKEQTEKDFQDFKNSRSNWQTKGVNFLSRVREFLPPLNNKKIKELVNERDKDSIISLRKAIKKRNKKIEKYKKIISNVQNAKSIL
jgi:hypothetical protein